MENEAEVQLQAALCLSFSRYRFCRRFVDLNSLFREAFLRNFAALFSNAKRNSRLT